MALADGHFFASAAAPNTLSNCPRGRSGVSVEVRRAAQTGYAYDGERWRPSAHWTRTRTTSSAMRLRLTRSQGVPDSSAQMLLTCALEGMGPPLLPPEGRQSDGGLSAGTDIRTHGDGQSHGGAGHTHDKFLPRGGIRRTRLKRLHQHREKPYPLHVFLSKLGHSRTALPVQREGRFALYERRRSAAPHQYTLGQLFSANCERTARTIANNRHWVSSERWVSRFWWR